MRRPTFPLPGWDVALLGLAVLVSNAPLLLAGQPSLALVYAPHAVSAGEWWRLLTHPLVHVSRYHLLLDGVAFLSLLAGLGDLRAPQRLALVGASAATSLAAASVLPGEAARYGLCGLSGVGHGLLAATAVLLVRDPDASTRRLGAVVLVLVVGKALGEALTGRLLLDLVHLGDLGRPNRLCHLGGVVGGGLAALLVAAPSRPRPALGLDRNGSAS
ncbi:MAG TPA: rhombosortase [Vicinamibacteria bacterium]